MGAGARRREGPAGPTTAGRPFQGIIHEGLERETGVEPATSTLARLHSTTELFPPRRPPGPDGGPNIPGAPNDCQGNPMPRDLQSEAPTLRSPGTGPGRCATLPSARLAPGAGASLPARRGALSEPAAARAFRGPAGERRSGDA